MTLLDIVNEVMKRLREDQVTSIDQTEYSALVGAFAYDAMRTVEDAWNWSGLREEEELLTVASQPNYPLTSLDNYDIITNIFSSTINTSLTEVTFSQMKEFQRRSVQADSTVQYWAWTNTSGGQKQIALWPRPATTETGPSAQAQALATVPALVTATVPAKAPALAAVVVVVYSATAPPATSAYVR